MSEEASQEWQGPAPLHNPIGVPRLGEIYSRTAAFYDGVVAAKQAVPKLSAIELLQRRPGERFLEIGTGTGWAFARILDASGPETAFALDLAPGMLEVTRHRLTKEHGHRAPALLHGDARALPFPDGSIDCLLNTYTFEVLPQHDIAPAIKEMLRVLRPAGRAVIVNLTDETDGSAAGEHIIEDWKQRYPADPEFFGGARPLQLAPMLRANGFETVERQSAGDEWPSEVLLAWKR